MTHIGQMTGQVMNPTMDMMEITPKVIGTAEELTKSEDKQSESVDVISEDRQTDQINRFCFSAICLFRFFGHELVEALAFMLLFMSLMYQCFYRFEQVPIQEHPPS